MDGWMSKSIHQPINQLFHQQTAHPGCSHRLPSARREDMLVSLVPPSLNDLSRQGNANAQMYVHTNTRTHTKGSIKNVWGRRQQPHTESAQLSPGQCMIWLTRLLRFSKQTVLCPIKCGARSPSSPPSPFLCTCWSRHVYHTNKQKVEMFHLNSPPPKKNCHENHISVHWIFLNDRVTPRKNWFRVRC